MDSNSKLPQVEIRKTVLQTDRDSFLGLYKVVSHHTFFVNLNDCYLALDKDYLRIIKPSTTNHVYKYSINEMRQMFYQGANVPALELRLDNLGSINVSGPNNLTHLLNELLGMKPPTTVYITYDPNTNYYSLLNSQFSHIMTLEHTNEILS